MVDLKIFWDSRMNGYGLHLIEKYVEERHMTWKKRILLKWVWFALTVSCCSLLWNLFSFIKYPEEGINYFWGFLFTPGDLGFRLPLMVTIALIYMGQWVASWTKRSRPSAISQQSAIGICITLTSFQ